MQAQLDRLTMISPGRDVLGLERIKTLLARLGDPHRALPPVFHVAGTNGKGSTCAFLRAMLEAAGYRVHAYTSPHLVRFNERIRIGGTLIDDADLAATLARVLDHADGLDASFFEITTAAALLRFAEEPADACVIEVGLGGRLDATNAIERPLVCGIASLGIDHREFLLSPDPALPAMGDMERIAFEKAGIAKWGAPLVTHSYSPAMNARIADVAQTAGATLMMRGRQWTSAPIGRSFSYADRSGKFYGKAPYLPGRHQLDNAALAIAMLRHQPLLPVSETAIKRGIDRAGTGARGLARWRAQSGCGGGAGCASPTDWAGGGDCRVPCQQGCRRIFAQNRATYYPILRNSGAKSRLLCTRSTVPHGRGGGGCRHPHCGRCG